MFGVGAESTPELHTLTPLEIDARPGVVLHDQATILQMLPDQLLHDVLRLVERPLVVGAEILTIEDDRCSGKESLVARDSCTAFLPTCDG